MVRIDRVTTRTGDDGTTALGDGRRLAKDHPLIAALGEVDEANAALGLARAQALPAIVATILGRIQQELFDLGADLCLPPDSPMADRVRRIGSGQLARLDADLVQANAGLPPLTSFILPAGSPACVALHQARVVMRRAERAVVTARRHGDPPVADGVGPYLNRCSDLLFVAARLAGGGDEALWTPGTGL